MRKSVLITLTVLLLLLTGALVYYYLHPRNSSDLKVTIEKLVTRIDSEQNKKDTGFFPPISFIENAGLYRSDVHLNFYGSYFKRLLRNAFAVPDSNMFITNFICLALFEAYEIGAIEFPKEQLDLAIRAITKFKNKNFNDTDLYTFWLQAKGTHLYSATPLNLLYGIKDFDDMSAVLNTTLRSIGLESIFKEYIQPWYDEFNMFTPAFKIPSDSDDTSVNLALNSVINKYKDLIPEAYQIWREANADLKPSLDAYLRYAYKPFSEELDNRVTDPRAYYFLHDFLKQRLDRKNLTLMNTWLTNLTRENFTYPDVGMPFHANNVDLSVNTNTLFGLGHVFIDYPELVTPELINLYSNIIDLIEFSVETEIVIKRPDLVLLYYPSIYDFYWFVSRNIFFLEENEARLGQLPFPILTEAKERLGKLMRNVGTNQMLAKMQEEGNDVYWDDFLGMSDGTLPPSGEDRLFSSGLVLNFLIDVWVTPNRTSLREDTPEVVKNVLKRGITFLNREILGDKYQRLNAFFSGSVKSNTTMPLYYPITNLQYINGKKVDPRDPNITFYNISVGVDGYVENYEELLNQTWFGKHVPREFNGYNSDLFPYWASPAMTDGVSLLALAKYDKLATKP